MTQNEFVTFITKKLDSLKDIPGETLYSALSTLKKGDIYLMGTNPGGSDNYLLSEDLEKLKSKKTNGYLDEEWETGKGKAKAGEGFLQKRVQKLISEIGYDLREVCASNLIFTKSVSLETLGYSFNDIADRCWNVHEEILKIVEPKIIIVFGNSESKSPYAYMKRKYNIKKDEIDSIKNYYKYNAKSFTFELNGRKTHVVGLPHLSRFAIKNNEIYPWIQNKIKS
jgi:hypothetical protein